MTDQEALREALIEVDLMRRREAEALRVSNMLLAAMERMTAADAPDAALEALMASAREAIEVEAVAILGPDRVIAQSTDPALIGLGFGEQAPDFARPRRIFELDPGWCPAPVVVAYGAMLAVPVPQDGATASVLCLAGARRSFTPADQRLLTRLAGLAGQAIAGLQLSRRNALLAAVIEGSSASVSIADARRTGMPLVYVNAAFERLSGYGRADALGRNCRFLNAEPHWSPVRSALRAAVLAREGGEFELDNRRRDGTMFRNQLTLFPVGGSPGAPDYLVATQIDVTERRRMEEERDLARRRLVSALSAAPNGFLVLDPDGRVVFANRRYRDFFEIGAEWLPGCAFADLWAARERALGIADAARSGQARLAALMAGREDAQEELDDGRILLINDRPLPVGGALSIAVDVTGLKATERLLRQRATAIDAVHDGIAITDTEGRFVYLNPSHCALFGHDGAERLIGCHWSVLYDAANAERLEREVMPELRRSGSWRGEIEGRARDGRSVEQELSLTLLDGVGLVCVTRDTSERRRDERERERLREQLVSAQRQEAVGQLAAGVAHDFNNVLSAISGSAALLLDDLGPDAAPGIAAHAKRIIAGGEAAAQLVRRLLRLGARDGETELIDLRTPLREALDLLRAGVPGRIALRVELPEEPVTVRLKASEVLQVVLNLCINARDAIGPASGEIGLTLAETEIDPDEPGPDLGSLEPGRRYARLSVGDSGCGMTPAQRAEIFRPYFTTKGDAGTGLGLAMVATVVQSAQGAVRVSSIPGEGTRFDIFWPLEAGAPRLPGPPMETATRLDGRLVLVVDDMPEIVQVIAATLERAGAEVAPCLDPADALEAVRDDPGIWDLVITDFDMPGRDGSKLAGEMRRMAPDLAILLCTALADWRGRGNARVFDAVLCKPVEPEALLKAAAAAMTARETALRGATG